MRPNRSIPSSTVVPVLIYPDVRAAVAWLEAAFGFVERVRIGEDHRAQLSFGDGAVARTRSPRAALDPSRFLVCLSPPICRSARGAAGRRGVGGRAATRSGSRA